MQLTPSMLLHLGMSYGAKNNAESVSCEKRFVVCLFLSSLDTLIVGGNVSVWGGIKKF